MPLNVEKDLPSLPEDAESGSRTHLPPPFTGGLANATRSRLMLDFEKPLSPEEIALLRHWNEATLARHVRFERQPVQHGRRLRSAPAPTEEAENIPGIASRGNDHTPTPTPKRLWGFFTRKKRMADASKSKEQAPKSAKSISSAKFLSRAKAAKSTPNLNAAAKAGAQEASLVVPPIPCEATAPTPITKQSTVIPTIKQATNTPVNQSSDAALQELEIDFNDGGIYLTFDPDWRTSCGDVVLTFLSPIPDEIPDSPIIHRRHSSDELEAWHFNPMPQPTQTGPKMDAIDELHSFLAFED